MKKHSFKDDYSEGVHPNILKALSEGNLIQEEGYGNDTYSKKAAELIRGKIKSQSSDIHFTSGGTQANLIVISAMLKSYESVIAAETGHIAVHEAGAVESTGHKINTIKTKNGKLTSHDLKAVIDQHIDEHMVRPRMVFISNSTEVGSIYKRKELEELSSFCKKNKLFLYLDGARLGSALTSQYNDITLAEMTKLVDVFYIGGTKNGALLGEAIVINNDKLKEDFRFYLKQKGGLLAKGRVLGIQFMEFFKEDLFFEIGKHANLMAKLLAQGIQKLNYNFILPPESNQIFPIFPDELIDKLCKKYEFHTWEKIDADTSAIRLVTSWATPAEAIHQFIADLRTFTNTNQGLL